MKIKIYRFYQTKIYVIIILVDYHITPSQCDAQGTFYIIIPVIRLLFKSFLDYSQLPGKYTAPCSLLGAHQLIKHSYHICPHRSPFILLGLDRDASAQLEWLVDLIVPLHRRVYSTVYSVLSECLWKKLHRRLGRDSNPQPPAY